MHIPRPYGTGGWVLFLAAGALLLGLFSGQPEPTAAAFQSVLATVETPPVPDTGDAADDIAIWIHPTNPSLSTVIGTDKLPGGGLGVYDLAGNQLYFYFAGNYNNVDLRYNFPLGADRVALVGVSNRTDPISLDFYKVNAADRSLTLVGKISVAGLPITRPRGFAMYHSPSSGKYYAFTTDFSTNVVFQFELNGSSGSVTGTLVRSFDNGNTSEGMVADDHLQRLYVSEEDVGIWRYGAEPGAGATRTLMDSIVATGGHLVNNIKNTAIYYKSDGGGYLVASSQGGGGSYQIYNRVDNAFVGEFKIPNGINGVDGVNGQDGIDLTNFNLGPAFPQGLFVSQDHDNRDSGNGNSGNQNFKYVPWQSIANAFTPALPIDSTFDPRTIGAPGGPPSPTPSPATTPSPSPTPAATATSTPSPTAGSTPSSTPTASPLPGNQLTVTPIDDAHVAGDLAGNNFGSTTDLMVDGSPIRDGFMKFDLRPLAGQTVLSAKLRMWVTNASGGTFSLKSVADSAWTEASLNYGNAPPKGPVVTTFQPAGVISTWVDITLTSAVASNAGAFFSLAMDTPSTDGYAFSSEEAASNKVHLLIQLGGTPAPSATPTPTPAATPSPAATPTVTPVPTPAAGGIRFQSATTTTNTTAVGSISIAKPAGTTAGDVLVASLALNGVRVTGVPPGWISIATATSVSTPKMYSYYRVAGAAEPASYSWTLSAAATSSGGIACYSGVDNASPLDGPAATAASSANVSSITVPAVTTTRPGAMLIGGVALNSSNTSVVIGGPGGMTERWDLGGKRGEYDDALQPSAGSSGDKTWTFSNARAGVAWLAALRPAP